MIFPLAMGDVDDAVALQRLQRLAHRGAADLIGVHQVAFARELVAGLKFPGPDALEQPVAHLLEQFSAGYGRDSDHGLTS